MQEEIVSYETAILAKEKGFDCTIKAHYTKTKLCTSDIVSLYNWNSFTDMEHNNYYYSAPTQSLLQKWIRENHNIHICADLHVSTPKHWYVRIDDMNTNDYLYHSEDRNVFFNSYEEALEIGLQESLKLIE